MTRGQIIDRVRIYIDELTEKRWKTTSIRNLIEEATNEVAALFLSLDESYYTQSDEFLLEPDEELYDLPSDFLRIKRIQDDKKYPISYIRASTLPNYEDEGEVRYYYFLGGQIGFRKVPAAEQTLSFLYVRTPFPLIDDNSSPDVPAFLGHDLICVQTAIDCLDLDEEMDTYLLRKRKDLIEQIKNVYYRRNTDDLDVVAYDPLLNDLEV